METLNYLAPILDAPFLLFVWTFILIVWSASLAITAALLEERRRDMDGDEIVGTPPPIQTPEAQIRVFRPPTSDENPTRA